MIKIFFILVVIAFITFVIFRKMINLDLSRDLSRDLNRDLSRDLNRDLSRDPIRTNTREDNIDYQQIVPGVKFANDL